VAEAEPNRTHLHQAAEALAQRNPPATVTTSSCTPFCRTLAAGTALAASILASATCARADTTWLDTGEWSVYEVTTPQDAACYLLVKIPTDAGRAAFGLSLYRHPKYGYIHYIEQGIRWAKGKTTLVQLRVDNNRTRTVQMRAGGETPDQLSAPLAPVPITFVKEELVKGHTSNQHTSWCVHSQFPSLRIKRGRRYLDAVSREHCGIA
jgi:hypothetical protein